MRLDTLTIKGVLAFPEERTLNFRDLPEGLIALRGPIGEGKTTILEAPVATLHREFPSREKRELFDYATGTDAFMQLVFELEGRGLFRARVNLDALHRKQEAVLTRREQAGGESFVSDKQSLKSYDAAIAGLIPPLPDLLASVIAVQTRRGSFSEAEKHERREMLQTLMGLDGYERDAARIRGALELVTPAVAQTKAGLAVLEQDDRPGHDLVLIRRSKDLEQEIAGVEEQRQALDRQIKAAEAELAGLEGQARAYDAATVRHRSAEQTLALRTAERDQLEATMARTLTDATADRLRLTQAHADWIIRNQVAQGDTTSYAEEIARLDVALRIIIAAAEGKIKANRDDLLGREAIIRAAVGELAGLDQEVKALRASADAEQVALDGHAAAERLLSATLADLQVKAAELARAQADAALLGHVPCGGRGEFEFCEFLTNAKTAEAQIAALADTPGLIATATTQLAAVRGQIEAARKAHRIATKAAATVDAQRDVVKVEADKLPYLEAAKVRIKALEQQIIDARAKHRDDAFAANDRERAKVARLQAEAVRQDADHAARLASFDAQLADRLTGFDAQLARIHDAIRDATVERDGAREAIDATRSAAAEANAAALRLGALRVQWDTATALSATLQAQLDTLEADVSQFVARRHRIEIQRARLVRLTDHEREWLQLLAACCREGLPTLEIDAASPRLTALFNDLLLASFGGRFTGKLVTQRAKAGGAKSKSGATHNEVIEFQIFDQEKGGAERDLHDLSGGQKVVVEEALRSAIALLVNQGSENPMRTMWRDETTGSLDPASAIAYVAMLRRVKEIGGFYHVIFATHSPACWTLADSQVIVGGGDITIALPPYDAEAFA